MDDAATQATDWASAFADQLIAEGREVTDAKPLVVASGISPSGRVHLGNLREVMVQHFVADEVRRRGVPCRHLFSWDDYDRFRRVPVGVDESYAEHIGRPLSAVPDPCGQHANWAEHFKEPLRESLAAMQVEVDEISQTVMYTSGAYAAQIETAMRRRRDIDAVLAKYRTKRNEGDEDEGAEQAAYYPFVPYCGGCGRDHATITSYDDATTELSYTSACGFAIERVPLREVAGKLAWKVDWPMRWAYEDVGFEAAGVDHATPGSSFTVGLELVDEIFNGRRLITAGYSFVGTTGEAKMSSSRGGAPTPGDALQFLEVPVLRWLYGRRRPNQSFNVAFGQETGRLYDEWDALIGRVTAGTAEGPEALAYSRASSTAAGLLPTTPRRLPFRTLASVIDITAGDPTQLLRIVGDLTKDDPVTDLAQLQPRLACAEAWVTTQLDPAERTRVRDEPNRALMADLTAEQHAALSLLLDGLEKDWSMEGLTTLLYGVPKQLAGLPADTAPTPELKKAQRAWFVLLYSLLTERDTGPRLPTLLLAIGAERVRSLIDPTLVPAV